MFYIFKVFLKYFFILYIKGKGIYDYVLNFVVFICRCFGKKVYGRGEREEGKFV